MKLSDISCQQPLQAYLASLPTLPGSVQMTFALDIALALLPPALALVGGELTARFAREFAQQAQAARAALARDLETWRAEWSEPLDLEPLTLKIGRQDLIYGEGFMILDGQDNVGSMAIAFDGVKASLALGEKTTLDLLAMKIEEHTKQSADDEDLYGLYLTDTSLFEDHKLEGYVLHRNRNAVDDYFASVGGSGAIIPKQHTTAVGGRISGSFLDKKLDVNGAFEYSFASGDVTVQGTYPPVAPGEYSTDAIVLHAGVSYRY